MGTLSITLPGTVESVSKRSNFNGSTSTTPGFAGIAGGSDDDTLRAVIADTLLALGYLADGQEASFISEQITYGFNENTAVFSLDGAAPISFNSLPAGFRITTLALSVSSISNIANTILHAKVNGDDITNSPSNPSLGVVVNTYTFPDMPLSASTFIDTQIQLAFTGTPIIPDIVQLQINALTISGTYEIVSFRLTWELHDTIVTPNVTPVTVTSGTLLFVGLTYEISYDIGAGPVFVPVTVITSEELHEVVFIVPDFPTGVYEIQVYANDPGGVQFHGRLPLGPLFTIYFTDATGIYQLVPGKTHDTLYNQNDPPNTINTKIPNPFGKTGFLP